MEVLEQKNGCTIFGIKRITDKRGWFSVQLNADKLSEYGFRRIVQLNHSLTMFKGTVRGFNYQEAPYQQAKLVRCVKGSLFSVAVNIDPFCGDFGKWCGWELSEDNCKTMLIPRTFAHGSITLQDNCEMEYFTDEVYSYENAKSIRYDDPDINVDWTLNGRIEPISDLLSDKNRNARFLSQYRMAVII